MISINPLISCLLASCVGRFAGKYSIFRNFVLPEVAR